MRAAPVSTPLADLRGMSNQEIFFIVYRGLHMQGFHKVMVFHQQDDRGEVCAYYDPKTGRRCAAGQLFPGEKLPEECQSLGISDLIQRNYLVVENQSTADKSSASQLGFIATLQRLHDIDSYMVNPGLGGPKSYPRNSLEDREVRRRRYRQFAIERKLIIPQNLPQAPIKDLYPLFGKFFNTTDKTLRR